MIKWIASLFALVSWWRSYHDQMRPWKYFVEGSDFVGTFAPTRAFEEPPRVLRIPKIKIGLFDANAIPDSCAYAEARLVVSDSINRLAIYREVKERL